MSRFLKWIGSKFRTFTITGPDGVAYMTRHFIYESKNFKVYLHQFHRSDQDRDLHTHPWNFVSFILSGGYIEHLATGPKYRKAPWIVRRIAHEKHKVELFKNADGSEIETWTLVFIGKKYKEWGFWIEEDGKPVWIHHREYFDRKFGKGQWHDADEFKQLKRAMDD